MAKIIAQIAVIAPVFLSLSGVSQAAVLDKRAVTPASGAGLPKGWTYQGCYSDNGNSRTLSALQTTSATMDGLECSKYCSGKGYVYSGIEYGNECWCDNAINSIATKQTDASCSMGCAGDATEACGGSYLITVYYANKAPPTPVSPVDLAAISPFTYAGCYTDNSAAGRALKNQNADDPALTVEKCVASCKAKGYTIAGMEYANQCFCDNYLRHGSTNLTDSKCNMGCAGKPAEMCGAGNILSVYSNGPINVGADPGIQQTVGSWTYKGCITDSADSRAFPYLITAPSNNSNTNCLNQCALFGFPAGGTEFGEQCFCGDSGNWKAAGQTIAPDSDCNMVCPDNANGAGGYYCGGPNRISYYEWNGAKPLTQWSYAKGNNAGKYQFLLSGPTIPLVTTPGRNGKVTYMEKFGTSPANNGTGAYELDLSLVGTAQNPWREMHVKSDIFCSASLTLPDNRGRQINIGGWADPATHGIRLYTPDGKPGVAGTNDWQENGAEVALLDGRWYPSAMTMANGSILVVGGEAGSNGAPVPTLELLPTVNKASQYCDYLDRTDPWNLYPYLAVLPSGGIFVAYYNEARILDPVTLQTKKVLPNIPGAVNDPTGGRTYPFEGTSFILPQSPSNGWAVTIVICGGSTPGPEYAIDNCVSINPDDASPKWTIERMPSKRVIPCVAALPDGTYLINNGALQGAAGFGLANGPNLNSILYNPTKAVNTRFTVMANTTIARLYHSESVLLDDGRVLVSGSDPEGTRAFEIQEYRNEVWIPPYLLGAKPRPAFRLTNLDWKYGQAVTFTVSKLGSGSIGSYKVSLMGAVASTHGNSMGQRTFFPATSCSGTTCTVTAPPNANVCPPSWFQVFLLDANNVPSTAVWVRIGGDPGKLGNWPPNLADFAPLPGIGPVKAL